MSRLSLLTSLASPTRPWTGEWCFISSLTRSRDLGATYEDVKEAEEQLADMPLDKCVKVLTQVRKMHQYDQNFPGELLDQINEFLDNPDVLANPDKHATLIHQMRLEALLVTNNSPYAMVRGVVDNFDDPTLPSLTFRVWFIGIIFVGIGAFINQLFDIRQPPVSVSSDVGQLLAFPFGKLLAKILPKKSVTLFGRSFSFNPGPFNRKEHMLITIMCTIGFTKPYTTNIVLVQALPQYFNQAYARTFSYQILNTLGSNFVGYGLAGMARRFIVYPSFCVWPASLSTLALNKAFHTDDSNPLPGPFKRFYYMSRMRFFLQSFGAMFIWYWFPAYIFQALQYFNWMAWIAPNNVKYTALVGVENGLGLNPWPTFDFNFANSLYIPLVLPFFVNASQAVGMFVSLWMIIGFWFTNAFNTAYLPINSNATFNNKGKKFNVTMIVDDLGKFVVDKYQNYSEPYMAAGNVTLYFWFFAAYSSTFSYVLLYHRHEIAGGFKGFVRSFKKSLGRGNIDEDEDLDLGEDIHYRLMQQYKEVPEWWYLCVLLAALGLGIAGVAAYDTGVTPAVVVFGIIMAFIAVVPIGLVKAVTGMEITLNVLAEFIGGSIIPGDALAMNYFKMYGYITCAHALSFCNDLKMAHYSKIPPRHTFVTQLAATLVGTLVTTAIFNFQMSFRDVCTPDAAFGMTCPGVNTFFTASIFWGLLSPHRIFGNNGRYRTLLIGFPVGLVLPIIQYFLLKKFPKVKVFRYIHAPMICAGALGWAPYNMSYMIATLYISWISWRFVKPRWIGFWSKYNFVLSAAWSSSIAICSIIIFFGTAIPEKEIEWWGNSPSTGCLKGYGCPLWELPEKGYFGGDKGTYQ